MQWTQNRHLYIGIALQKVTHVTLFDWNMVVIMAEKYQVISGHVELYSSLNNCILQRLHCKGQIGNIDKPYNQIMQILTVPSACKIWQ